VKALPVKRHFIPSLLLISWAERDQSSPLSDFIDMVRSGLLYYFQDLITDLFIGQTSGL